MSRSIFYNKEWYEANNGLLNLLPEKVLQFGTGASGRPGTLLQINAVDAKDISHFSKFKAENEYTIPPNSCHTVRVALSSAQVKSSACRQLHMCGMSHTCSRSAPSSQSQSRRRTSENPSRHKVPAIRDKADKGSAEL